MFPTEVIGGEEIRRIGIRRATEEGNEGQIGSVTKAVDREFGTEEGSCYVPTGASVNVWISLEVAWSLITHVNILVPYTAGELSFFSATNYSVIDVICACDDQVFTLLNKPYTTNTHRI